jgi:hypothetical protein
MKSLLVMLALAAAIPARAESGSRDAGKHFQRGVDLYNDGDFRGALVEFKKAYETWPRANVLYDIGQTQYQLLDYAGSLATMSRYLAETGPTAVHRAEVETTVEILRQRVGRVALTTASGCEVSIDDQPAGSTPLLSPLVVSVGLRRFTVTCAGRPVVTRQAEVAAGERFELEIKVPAPLVQHTPAVLAAAKSERKPTRAGMVAGWTASALLVTATIASGASTLVEASHLDQLRGSYPVTRPDLDRRANLVSGLSIASDVMGACAVVAVGLSTYLTVKYRKETRVHVAANGLRVAF